MSWNKSNNYNNMHGATIKKSSPVVPLDFSRKRVGFVSSMLHLCMCKMLSPVLKCDTKW
jgi:hypothetical protein